MMKRRSKSRMSLGAPGWTALLFPLIFAVATAAVHGCSGKEGAAEKAKDVRPIVTATTTMIADMAREIAGDDVQVVGIMRPGEDPHIYDPLPQDAINFSKADLVLTNGLHLEGTLSGIIDNNLREGAELVKLAETPEIKPLESEMFKGAPDPHCWMNVAHFMTYARRTRDALIRTDPAHKEGYEKRASGYLDRLKALDETVREGIASIPKERRLLVTSHDAFQYFGLAYDIETHSVIGISTEEEPKPKQVEDLARIVKERGVKAVFFESSVSANLNALVEKVAVKTGVKLGGRLHSDSLGEPGGPAGTYEGMMRTNIDAIVQALR